MNGSKIALALWIAYDLAKLLQYLLAGLGGTAEFVLVLAVAVMLANVVRRPPALAVRRDGRALAACAISLGAVAGALSLHDAHYTPNVASDLLAIASSILLLFAAIALGRSFTVLPAAIQTRARGPYAFVRHPIYGAYFLAGAALAIGYANWIVIIACAIEAAALVWRAKLEEQTLSASLPSYSAYRSRVRAMFIPGLI